MWSHETDTHKRKIEVFYKLTGSLQKQLKKNPEHTASRRYHHSVRSRAALYHTIQSHDTQTRCTVPLGGNQSQFARNFMCKITDNP
jgi:hypothetical protein